MTAAETRARLSQAIRDRHHIRLWQANLVAAIHREASR